MHVFVLASGRLRLRGLWSQCCQCYCPKHYGKLGERLVQADVNIACDDFWQEWMLPHQAGYVSFKHLDGSLQMLKGGLPCEQTV